MFKKISGDNSSEKFSDEFGESVIHRIVHWIYHHICGFPKSFGHLEIHEIHNQFGHYIWWNTRFITEFGDKLSLNAFRNLPHLQTLLFQF